MSGRFPSRFPGPPYRSEFLTQPNDQEAMPELSSAQAMVGIGQWPNVEHGLLETAQRTGITGQIISTEPEHVKHRRTRSGCYTCRGRRVKCDESHPVCERCKKGSRECVYPIPRPNAKPSNPSRMGQRSVAIHDIDSSSDEADVEDLQTPSFPSDGPPNLKEPERSAEGSRKPSLDKSFIPSGSHRNQSSYRIPLNVGSLDDLQDRAFSPSVESSSTLPTMYPTYSAESTHEGLSSASTDLPSNIVSWPNLTKDIQFYIAYYQTHLTYHYYFFKNQSDSFLHNTFLKQALSYTPLLFAIVGFSAFQMALKKLDSRIEDFLGYYDKSVTLLRKSLAGGQRHSEPMLLTILQLATFEEYLGDWVNLLGHQKAAYRMLLELYTVETIMETETGRKILAWYSRFDIMVGLMSGHETFLGREWFCAEAEFYRRQSEDSARSIEFRIESAIASHRLVAIDMNLLFAKLPQGDIAMEEFVKENEQVAKRMSVGKKHLDMLIAEAASSTRKTVAGGDSDSSRGVIKPLMPGGIFTKGLWTLNIMLMDWYGVEIMHKYQSALLQRQQPPSELAKLALEMSSMIEAIDCWQEGPPGAVLSAHAHLGIAALFLPKDNERTMWCRRKLARIEGMGYIYPLTFRAKMAQVWGLPEVRHWWLPNDEGYPDICRNIRAFIEDRHYQNDQTQNEDLRSMKAIFSKFCIGDNP